MIRVIVAARSSISRAGLESVVHSSPALELVRSLDFALLLNLTETELNADVLLLEAGDIQPDRMRVLSLPTVLLIEMPDPALVSAALAAGIRGVLSREATVEEIEGAVHAVSVGLVVVGGAEMPSLVAQSHPIADILAEPLSEREIEVLDLIAEGLSNKLIAYQLTISEHTVKTHVASILAKLGVSSRTEAVSQAIRRGLVKL